MTAEDFVCDFCGRHWRDDLPMMEGHKGSLICGSCLSMAHAQVIVRNQGVTVPEHASCAMCLLNKSGDYWQSGIRVQLVRDGTPQDHSEIDVDPSSPGACICRWCIERSADMLSKDASAQWKPSPV